MELQGTKSRCEEEEGDVGIGGEQKRGWSGLPVGGSCGGCMEPEWGGGRQLKAFLGHTVSLGSACHKTKREYRRAGGRFLP